MGRMFLLCVCVVAACGGPQIPEHNGYKSDHAKPWKKAKTLKFDDQNTSVNKGDLSYPDMRRAAWYDLDLTQQADIDVAVEAEHDDTVNENFDFGVEVLDPGFRKLLRKDLEEGDSQGDEKKLLQLKDLVPGHYWIHLYLQGRLDTASYKMRVALHPSPPTVGKSDFPAQVAFVQPLPMVPISDDTPKNYKPPAPAAVVVKHTVTPKEPPPKKEPPPPTTLSARIIGVSVVAGGTQITVGRGTSSGAQAGMKGRINGLANGTFTLASCNERACTATVAATTDQIKSAGSVSLIP